MSIGAEKILRGQIIEHLNELASASGTVTRDQLWDFDLDGTTHRLIDRSRGIRNPRTMSATLSIMSTPDGPYADQEVDGSLFAYAYRDGSEDGDNAKLRRAYELELPIILLRKLSPGLYMPICPVYVVKDDREKRQFLIALDAELLTIDQPLNPTALERKYVRQVTKRRLHQPEFRARVLLAYKSRCAVCRLDHGKLLDAAHIIPDPDDDGAPVVENGLSLCKIHHAAYDTALLGIDPDYRIHISPQLSESVESPIIEYGFHQLNGGRIAVPNRRADRPDADRLRVRFERFREAC
ncbi:HNH endonuclease [Nocardia tengchongensis]|uniref:HNH endonuclease n=1 Tax=Nocardia tengchongensis TaxID=2055889 RepID=UPI0033DD48C4